MEPSTQEQEMVVPQLYFRAPRHYGTWLLIALFVFFLTLFIWTIAGTARYVAFIEVVERGHEKDADLLAGSLDFGALSAGMSATRVMKVENKTFLPMRIIIVRTGDVNELVRLSKNYFRLPAGDETTLELNAYVLPSMVPGTFSQGSVTVFKIPFI